MTANPVAIARDLLRCPSVTPDEGGALAYLHDVLAKAGFDVHRMTFAEPGTAPIENLYARVGSEAPISSLPDTPTSYLRATRRRGRIRRLPVTWRAMCFTGVAPST